MGNGMEAANEGTVGDNGWSMTGTAVVADARGVSNIEGVRGLGCAMAFVFVVADGLAFVVVFAVVLARESPEPLGLTGLWFAAAAAEEELPALAAAAALNRSSNLPFGRSTEADDACPCPCPDPGCTLEEGAGLPERAVPSTEGAGEEVRGGCMSWEEEVRCEGCARPSTTLRNWENMASRSRGCEARLGSPALVVWWRARWQAPCKE